MMRLLGAALLAGGCVLVGICAVKHLAGRVRDLDQLTLGLEVLRREVEHCLLPLPEGLERAAAETTGGVAVFFRLAAQGAGHLNGRTFQQVWHQAVDAGQMRLEEPDLHLLGRLGGVLGRYDGDSQCRALEDTMRCLKQQRAGAEEQSHRLGRLYSVLSLTAGGFLLVLLI